MIDLIQDLGERPSPTTELAPGVFRALDPKALGKYCLARWKANRDGTHSLTPVTGARAVLNAKLLQRLGMVGCERTLIRLGRAGFIVVTQVAPRVRVVDLDSLKAHEEEVTRATREGRPFWSGKNAKRYHEALAMEEG